MKLMVVKLLLGQWLLQTFNGGGQVPHQPTEGVGHHDHTHSKFLIIHTIQQEFLMTIVNLRILFVMKMTSAMFPYKNSLERIKK